MSARRPLLHVGLHKTGTTWLQERLFASGEAGFCTLSHRKDALHVFVYPHALDFDPAAARAFYETAWQACPPSHVPVLSMERFSGTPHAGRYDSVEIAHRLHRSFPEARVLIVVREQDDIILSGYRQYVKNSGARTLSAYLHPRYDPSVIHGFSFAGFHYDRLVALYDGLFGADNVLVLPYEQFREDAVGYMRTIARFAGLDPDDDVLENLRPQTRENPSYTALSTSIKRRINRLASRTSALNPTPPVRLRRRGVRWVKRTLFRAERWLPQGTTARLDTRDRARVRAAVGDRYRASNAALAGRMGVDLARYGYRMPHAEAVSTPAPHDGDEPLTLHILYTPRTVELLTPFVPTLLHHSPFRYRLVANGCSDDEVARLEAVAASSDRVEVVRLPGDAVCPHAEAVEALFDRSEGARFAFMDSDVFAVAPFGEAVTRGVAQSELFTACAQPWSSPFDRATMPGRALSGRNLSAAGRYVGTTFFAVYDRAAVERVRERYGVGFAKYRWASLPEAARARLADSDLHYTRYDTAKALNLLLHADGARVAYDALPALVHLGGVSDRAQGARSRAAGRPRQDGASPLRRAYRRARRWLRRTRSGAPDATTYQDRRSLAWQFFGDALRAHHARRPPPPVPVLGDALAQREVERAARELSRLFAGGHDS